MTDAASWRQRRVAVIGCGGLGVPGAWTLVCAGVERLRLIDTDVVEVSNLHRQVLYNEDDAGAIKTERLAAQLKSLAARLGQNLEVETREARMTARDAEMLLHGCDVAFEGTDDAVSKFVVNDWAIADRAGANTRIAAIGAAIGRRGQWMVVKPGGACYRCLFEEAPPADMLATCQVAGVIGPVVGQVGAMCARSLVSALKCEADPGQSALIRRVVGGFKTTAVDVAEDCRCARGWRACG